MAGPGSRSPVGRTGKAPLCGRSFVWTAGARAPLDCVSSSSHRLLPPAAPKRTALGAAHLGVLPQPVRVKFENRLVGSKSSGEGSQQLLWRGGSSFFFFLPPPPFEDCFETVFRVGRDFVGNSRVRLSHFVGLCYAFESLTR